MNNIKRQLKFLYISNLKAYQSIIIIWMLFLISVIATSVLRLPNIASAMALGLTSSAVTFIVIQIFVNQYIVFPYSVNLGFTRDEYIKGVLAFNLFTSFFLVICIYVISLILNLLGTGYSPVSFPSAPQLISFILIAGGLNGITALVSLIFYSFRFFYGISFLLFILSPFVYFRHQIIDILLWQTYRLLPCSAGFLVLGLLAALISNKLIKRTEVR